MTRRMRLIAPLLVLSLALGFAFAVPAVAMADTLVWDWPLPFTGPRDIPNGPEIPPTEFAGAFNGVSFAGPANGWAVGVQIMNPDTFGPRSGIIYSTHDGGATWAPESVETTRELNAVYARSATDVWAVGMAGEVLHWDGSSWTARTIPGWNQATKSLYGVAFATADLGWAVGDGLSVVRTTDGGDTWSIVTAPSGTSVLRSVAVADASSALAVGDGGTMKRLTNGVPTAVFSGTSASLWGITFASPANAWAVGANATMIRSTDGGLNWETVTRPIPEGFTALDVPMRSVAFSGDVGIAVSAYQCVWRTGDGGATWSVAQMPPANWLPDLDLRGAAIAGASNDAIVVSRHSGLDLSTRDQKARVHRGIIPPPAAPTGLSAVDGGAPRPRVRLTWTDAASDEDGFVVQRANGSTASEAFSGVATLGRNVTTWTDTSADWRSTWYYRVRSYRGSTVSAWSVSPGIAVDNIAPVTTADIAGSYLESATIVLHPADNAGGSGLARTRYVLDHATAVDGTSVTVRTFGAHTIAYWSDDVAGNPETPVTVNFLIVDPTIEDTQAPVTDAFVEPYYTGPATIQFTATDMPMFGAASGVAYTYYRIDGAAPKSGASAAVPQVAGPHEIVYWSVDARGNTEAPRGPESFFVDLAAPVTTSNAMSDYYGAGTITLTPSDPGGVGASGLQATYFSIDDGPRMTGTSVPVAASPLGAHHVDFQSVDKAGNVEATKTAAFTVGVPAITPPPTNGTPTVPVLSTSSVRHGRSFGFRGYVIKHTAGTYPVTLQFYRYKSGRWVYYKSTSAKASTVLTFSKYYDSTSVPYAGSWRVRARHKVGSHYHYSGYVTFRAS